MRKNLVFSFLVCIALAALAAADSGMPQAQETQGFSTLTSVKILGLTSESDSLVWQEVNCGICGLQDITPLFSFAHAYYVSSYREDTLADQGLATYTKTTALDTSAKVANQYNLETTRVASFVGSGTGRMTSSEDLLLDGAGTFFPAEFTITCPFGSAGLELYSPTFCNVLETGSSIDLVSGSLATRIGERHVMAANSEPTGEEWPVPVSDPGVAIDSDVRVTGVDASTPALGSATAFLNAHIQEGRTFCEEKSLDLTWSERTSASGSISLFQKTMQYRSRITEPGVAPG